MQCSNPHYEPPSWRLVTLIKDMQQARPGPQPSSSLWIAFHGQLGIDACGLLEQRDLWRLQNTCTAGVYAVYTEDAGALRCSSLRLTARTTFAAIHSNGPVLMSGIRALHVLCPSILVMRMAARAAGCMRNLEQLKLDHDTDASSEELEQSDVENHKELANELAFAVWQTGKIKCLSVQWPSNSTMFLRDVILQKLFASLAFTLTGSSVDIRFGYLWTITASQVGSGMLFRSLKNSRLAEFAYRHGGLEAPHVRSIAPFLFSMTTLIRLELDSNFLFARRLGAGHFPWSEPAVPCLPSSLQHLSLTNQTKEDGMNDMEDVPEAIVFWLESIRNCHRLKKCDLSNNRLDRFCYLLERTFRDKEALSQVTLRNCRFDGTHLCSLTSFIVSLPRDARIVLYGNDLGDYDIVRILARALSGQQELGCDYDPRDGPALRDDLRLQVYFNPWSESEEEGQEDSEAPSQDDQYYEADSEESEEEDNPDRGAPIQDRGDSDSDEGTQ